MAIVVQKSNKYNHCRDNASEEDIANSRPPLNNQCPHATQLRAFGLHLLDPPHNLTQALAFLQVPIKWNCDDHCYCHNHMWTFLKMASIFFHTYSSILTVCCILSHLLVTGNVIVCCTQRYRPTHYFLLPGCPTTVSLLNDWYHSCECT